MGRDMLRIIIIAFCIVEVSWGLTPRVAGLSGAGRAGIAQEALFTNPAAVAALSKNAVFYSFLNAKNHEKTNLKPGKSHVLGAYDAMSSSLFKGGVAYVSEFGHRVLSRKGPIYQDRKGFMGAFAAPFSRSFLVGFNVKAMQQDGGKAYHTYGDFGLIYFLLPTIPVGFVVSNFGDKEGEDPRSIAGGIQFDLAGPLSLYFDYGRFLSIEGVGNTFSALALELTFYRDFVLRGGWLRNELISERGSSLGFSWNGPRTAFEYALKKTVRVVPEFNHSFGIRVVF